MRCPSCCPTMAAFPKWSPTPAAASSSAQMMRPTWPRKLPNYFAILRAPHNWVWRVNKPFTIATTPPKWPGKPWNFTAQYAKTSCGHASRGHLGDRTAGDYNAGLNYTHIRITR